MFTFIGKISKSPSKGREKKKGEKEGKEGLPPKRRGSLAALVTKLSKIF